MSRKEELKLVIEEAHKLMNAPSCYAGLRDRAQAWVDSIDTDKEANAAKTFLDELKEDITPIDNLVAFAHSDNAVTIFGADGAKKFAAHADEIKSKGAKWCDCAACSAGLAILDNKKVILNS